MVIFFLFFEVFYLQDILPLKGGLDPYEQKKQKLLVSPG